MLTNEIKKGMHIRLRNGWEADMMDNLKGNTRLADFGYEHEMGSVYSHDIVACKPTLESEWAMVEHTPAQLKLKKIVDAW